MSLSHQQKTRLSNDLKKIADKIEKLLKQSTGEEMAFSLIVWGKFGEDNMIQYVANAQREDCIKYMLELLQSWIKGMPDIKYEDRQ